MAISINNILQIDKRQLAWFLLFRFLMIFLLLSGALVYYWNLWVEGNGIIFVLLSCLFGVFLFQSLLFFLLLPRVNSLINFVRLQIVFDLLLSITLIYLTGGVESPFAFLMLIVIISSAIFQPRREVFSFASAAVILYGGLLDLQYYQYLPRISGIPWPSNLDTRSVLYTLYVNVTAFLLIAFLSGLLAGRLRRSELARELTEIDFQELESLHLAIQAHISSGLMIVNPLGKIRVFNREAERITGYRLTEVYDRRPEEFFPLFVAGEVLDARNVERAEGVLRTRDGSDRTVGYNISPVYNPEGATLGQLINFQDLTRFKSLEEQIKRADRLAAIGRLASGLAHEIRNPLASISGSVQLLLEQDCLGSEDRHLMRIVVREADRLSSLLGEFLAFARPAIPKCCAIEIANLVDDLLRIATVDARFKKVAFERSGLDELQLFADPEQFRQVLWNLLLNAADAMPGGGRILIGASATGTGIVVEDSGPGIPDGMMQRIFEPFFTTKEGGTGLGLATVYAIVDAHGATIRVENAPEKGARFIIEFPSLLRQDEQEHENG